MPNEYTCVICQTDQSDWGNNPWPVRNGGRCCDDCNAMVVIPMRIQQITAKTPKETPNAQ